MIHKWWNPGFRWYEQPDWLIVPSISIIKPIDYWLLKINIKWLFFEFRTTSNLTLTINLSLCSNYGIYFYILLPFTAFIIRIPINNFKCIRHLLYKIEPTPYWKLPDYNENKQV
jgi:hypothetical protein